MDAEPQYAMKIAHKIKNDIGYERSIISPQFRIISSLNYLVDIIIMDNAWVGIDIHDDVDISHSTARSLFLDNKSFQRMIPKELSL